MNTDSIRLIRSFVEEKLNGDIEELISFDVKQLKGDRRYGSCNGGGFDSDNTSIVRAVLAVAFEDVWPDFDENALAQKKYRGDTINTFNTMFGPKLGSGGFEGLNLFNPDEATLDRVDRFYHVYSTIGNMVPLPNRSAGRYTLNTFRGTYSKWRDYFDEFLFALRSALADGVYDDQTFEQLMEVNSFAFHQYAGESGFLELCKGLMLDDYINDTGEVKHLFPVVYWWNRELTRDRYLSAVDKYLDFCESFIVNRSKLIVEFLKKKLKEDGHGR